MKTKQTLTQANVSSNSLRAAIQFLTIAVALLIVALFSGCAHDETIRPEGYQLGLRASEPFAIMIANAHPEPVALPPVTFAFDSAELDRLAQQTLKRTALDIREGGRKITIYGHTDSVNTENYNADLGMARALAVRDYLWQSGVPKEWMTVRSRGKFDPADSNITPTGQAKNRRVEIVMEAYGTGRSGEEILRALKRQREAQDSAVADSSSNPREAKEMGQ